MPFCHLEDDEFKILIFELANGPENLMKPVYLVLNLIHLYLVIEIWLFLVIWIETLILSLKNCIVIIIQNINLMKYCLKKISILLLNSY